MPKYTERATLHPKGFNYNIELPYGLRVGEVKAAMDAVYDFLYRVNAFLVDKGWDRLEETLGPATFSTMMSDLIVESVSRESATLTKNRYHNGHPDLLPSGKYNGDAVRCGSRASFAQN